jgi:ribonucleoside-diphosphate reductase alpha chain
MNYTFMDTIPLTGASAMAEFVAFDKYCQRIPDLNRKESWHECVDRSVAMHVEKFPQIEKDILKAFEFVYDKRVLPSMRALQFGGKAALKSNARLYNCAYTIVNHPRVFSEVLYLLMMGCGVGWNVMPRHVFSLPNICEPGPLRKFVIADSCEGWADATKALVKAYFFGSPLPRFDFSEIRKRGEPLSSGGYAPGPEPLRIALEHCASILRNKAVGDKLTPIEAHDMLCHLSDAVLSGGIRRSAAIALFDPTDYEMLYAKAGNFFEENPQRARANNSAMLLRGATTRKQFGKLWDVAKYSGAGEPGIYWTNDKTYRLGANPCVEISLNPDQFCNLTTINESTVVDAQDFRERAWAATVIGTIQAGYTDFHYLSPSWKEQTEKEALLGVSRCGTAAETMRDVDLAPIVEEMLATNALYAEKIGINPAARVTTVKPEGSTSLVMGTHLPVSSGIHAYYAPYYLRRATVLQDTPTYKHLLELTPDLIEDSVYKPGKEAYLKLPMKAPDGAITTFNETPIEFLERVKTAYEGWIKPGHRSGQNTHNVSATVHIPTGVSGDVSVDFAEWDKIGDWMWENRNSYAGLSVFPAMASSVVYPQTPFEQITKAEYDVWSEKVKPLELWKVEVRHQQKIEDTVACAGGACEL